jgi:hypothetical protein
MGQCKSHGKILGFCDEIVYFEPNQKALVAFICFACCISICRLHRDYQAWASQKPLLMWEIFEIELEILYGRMGLEVIGLFTFYF